MSDSDDTEELLSVPPNSHCLNPELYLNEIPGFRLVDCLIKQINTLQKRVNSIETMSEPSWKDSSTEEYEKFRRFDGSREDLWSSYQSSPKKPWKLSTPFLVSPEKEKTRVQRSLRFDRDSPHKAKTFASQSSSDSSQTTVFEKLTDNGQIEVTRLNSVNNYKLESVSLSNLWNSEYTLPEHPLEFGPKLEEEKLRRIHCEQTIVDLQHRILELQERLAVAVQVDEAKDKALVRSQEQLERIETKLKELEQEKIVLENETKEIKQKYLDDTTKAGEKISQFEMETSKAINYANFNRGKQIAIEKELMNVKTEFEVVQNKYEDLQERYVAELEKNKRLPELLTQKEMELEEMKMTLTEARKEVIATKVTLEMCQGEISSLRNEYQILKTSFGNEKELVKELLKEKDALSDQIKIHETTEKGLHGELDQMKKQMETKKQELKSFYQGQVELVVQNKLKEFQKQLESAEKKLKDESVKKELSFAKLATSRVQQISEKYTQEIALLEKKHQEESRLYQLQISRLYQDVEESHVKLKKQQDKHTQIEQELRRFMETLNQDQTDDTNASTLKTRTYPNLEEIFKECNFEHVSPKKLEKEAKKVDVTLKDLMNFFNT